MRAAPNGWWLRGLLVAIPACLAFLVLCGWWTGDEGLKHLWLSRVAMNPATAVSLLALTVSMGLTAGPASYCRMTGIFLTLGTGVIGALVLADDVFATGIRPDKLLFPSHLAVAGGPPNRMAPNTALCLLILSSALFIANRPGPNAARAAQTLALAAMVIASFAIIGHLYNVTVLYGVGSYFLMAAHTAAAFIAVGVYVLVTTTHGPAALLADRGSTGAMMRRLIPTTLMLPIAVGGVGLFIATHCAVATDVVVAAMAVANMILLTTLVAVTGFKLHATDIARRHAEMKLVQLACTDFLTGLPNRARFIEHLMQRMSSGWRFAGKSFAVIYMDLDGFKVVNDTLGHAAGDLLLQEVAEHLRACAQPEDIVARFGGDEFTMLLNNVNSADEATRVASRIVENMPKTATSSSQAVPVGISVGLVVSDSRHITFESVLSDADEALYRAKRNGRGRFILFSEPGQPAIQAQPRAA